MEVLRKMCSIQLQRSAATHTFYFFEFYFSDLQSNIRSVAKLPIYSIYRFNSIISSYLIRINYNSLVSLQKNERKSAIQPQLHQEITVCQAPYVICNTDPCI